MANQPILNSKIGTTDCTEHTENEWNMRNEGITSEMMCPRLPTSPHLVHSVNSVVHHFPSEANHFGQLFARRFEVLRVNLPDHLVIGFAFQGDSKSSSG